MDIDEQLDTMGTDEKYPRIDDSNTKWQSKPKMERLIQVLDHIDTKVETLRKEALKLLEQRDNLITTIDFLKNNDRFDELTENEREEFEFYVKRVQDRLQTIDLKVQTVRNESQVDSLHEVNILIDAIITIHDPISKRQKCQEYLNACSSSEFTASTSDAYVLSIDKKFENVLLNCALDDQKTIKKRLNALLVYMGSQIISD